MAEVPHDWAAYACCQQQLSKRASMDDSCWGLETGLNAILDRKLVGNELAETDIKRAIASASRSNRYRVGLLKKFEADLTSGDVTSPLRTLAARSDLAKLAFTLSSENYQLLISLGYGEERFQIAEKLDLSEAALRARVSRARSQGRKLLAA